VAGFLLLHSAFCVLHSGAVRDHDAFRDARESATRVLVPRGIHRPASRL